MTSFIAKAVKEKTINKKIITDVSKVTLKRNIYNFTKTNNKTGSL